MHFSGFNFTRLFLLNRQCFFTSITSTGILWSGSGVVLDYGQALLEIKKNRRYIVCKYWLVFRVVVHFCGQQHCGFKKVKMVSTYIHIPKIAYFIPNRNKNSNIVDFILSIITFDMIFFTNAFYQILFAFTYIF